MTTIPLRIRLLTAAAAVTITLALFQTVASFSRPTTIEQLAQANKAAVTVASVRAAGPERSIMKGTWVR
jgi:hypothetical protein